MKTINLVMLALLLHERDTPEASCLASIVTARAEGRVSNERLDDALRVLLAVLKQERSIAEVES